MRVLAICEEDPEWILGGMGRHLRELYRAMAEREDVEIDLLVGGPSDEHYEYLGTTKYHSDKLVCWKPQAPNMASLLVGELQMARTLTRLIAEGKRWDLVHVHEWNAVQVARIARDALKIPLVGTMHLCITHLMTEDSCPTDKRPTYSEPDVYLMQQEGHLIVDSDELILCSHGFERIVRRHFMTERPINVIQNGIRCDEWVKSFALEEKARRDLDIPNDRPVALFVGRIADMKGVREILEMLRYHDPGYLVILCGEVNANTDEEKEQWEVTQEIRELEKRHPSRLRWVGFQSDDYLKGLYSIAEVGLMPSLHEPFGIVALEFMSMGVPLIATECDGLGEIVKDDEGGEYALIIDRGDSEQIYEALKFMRQNMPAREELSMLGRRRALAFDWNIAAARTVEVYETLLRRHHERSVERAEAHS